MPGSGFFRRASGVVGFFFGVFGMAGWQDHAQAWAEWATMNPQLSGVLVGAGATLFLVWLVLEVRAFLLRRKSSSHPATSQRPDIRLLERPISRATPETRPLSEASANPGLRKALEEEAEAKALSDEMDARFRTRRYRLNAFLGQLFMPAPPKDSSPDHHDRDG